MTAPLKPWEMAIRDVVGCAHTSPRQPCGPRQQGNTCLFGCLVEQQDCDEPPLSSLPSLLSSLVEANDSIRRHLTPSCNFQKSRLKLHVVSAFSLVQDYNTFIYERLLSTLVANVARVAFSQTYFGWWRRFRPNVAAVSERRFRPNFGHLEFICFWVCNNHRNSRTKSGICCRVRTSFLRVGAVVLAYTFPRPFVVVDFNQFTQQGSRAPI